jgi:hypothetical protein
MNLLIHKQTNEKSMQIIRALSSSRIRGKAPAPKNLKFLLSKRNRSNTFPEREQTSQFFIVIVI